MRTWFTIKLHRIFLPWFVIGLSVCSFSFRSTDENAFAEQRAAMVEFQIQGRGITNPRVIEAMLNVKRHLFVPDSVKKHAYQDSPLPIGFKQTISQPYIVAFMTEALKLNPEEKILEIGTGSGYQAAVLGEIVREVYSIEIIPELASEAEKILNDLDYSNVHVKEGDGYEGWPEKAPFDAIIVTAAPDHIPQALVSQLKTPGGRMIVPVGTSYQELLLIIKTQDGVKTERLLPVRFVPMVRKAI